MKRSVEETWKRLVKYETITENTINKCGRISEKLAEEFLWTQIDYAISKDDRSDRFLRDK